MDQEDAVPRRFASDRAAFGRTAARLGLALALVATGLSLGACGRRGTTELPAGVEPPPGVAPDGNGSYAPRTPFFLDPLLTTPKKS